MQYCWEEIESILQTSYYDRRTDYVWKYLMGNMPELETILYPIPSLESFQVMHDMLKKRNKNVYDFLEEWKATENKALIDCLYNERSGILRIKARSFTFTYRSKSNEYHFVTYAKIAKSIGLKNRITLKRYRKEGLFALSYLYELDEHLYSRYTEKQRIMEWRKSPQFATDCQYCKNILPFIMHDAEQRSHHLGADKRLNIILSGNDKVRIGIVKDYSPEEMIHMPCYLRSEWQKGILAAFDKLDKEYTEELALHRLVMQQWSNELSNIIMGKTPFCIEEHQSKYISDHLDETYSKIVLAAALGIEDKIAATLQANLVNQSKNSHNRKMNSVMQDLFDSVLQDRQRDYQASMKKKGSPQYILLVDEMKYIIQQTAPLIAYSGQNQTIRKNYKMYLYIVNDEKIKVKVQFSDWDATGSFDLESYQNEFRVWWSQQLLKECKYAKQCALNPEDNNPFDQPF